MRREKQKNVVNQVQPHAWITKQKNRVKSHSSKQKEDLGIVYLEDSQEFEIELYNPTKFSTLVKILINGNCISNAGIILKPGQRWFLDRYIDSNKKFLYSTYDVEDSEGSKEAISYNGLVEIKFYPETINTENENIPYNGLDWLTPYWQIDWGKPTIFYTDPDVTNSPRYNTTSVINTASDITMGSNDLVMLNSNVTYSPAVDISGGKSKETMSALNSKEKFIETGRVGEGSKSDQIFIEETGTFNNIPSNICKYHILPISIKPIEKGESRKYCTNCSLRIRKSKWKFCPNCGQNI